MKRIVKRAGMLLIVAAMVFAININAFAESGYNENKGSDNSAADSFTVSQTITPARVTANAIVTYTVKPLKEAGVDMPVPTADGSSAYTFDDGTEGISFSLQGGSSARPATKVIHFDVSGKTIYRYRYEVKAVSASANDPAIVLAEDVYTINLDGHNSKGNTVKRTWATTTMDGANKHKECEFNHLSECYVSHDPPVQKTISGDKPSSASVFSFRLVADKASYPMPEEGTGAKGTTGKIQDLPYKEISVSGEGEAEFGDIYFYSTGTYSYKIYEVDTKVKGYSYDNAVYKIIYKVTKNSRGVYSAERTMLKNDKATSIDAKFSFVNTYDKSKAGGGNRIWKAVKTGDPTTIALFAVLLVLSVIILLLVLRKKRKEAE